MVADQVQRAKANHPRLEPAELDRVRPGQVPVSRRPVGRAPGDRVTPRGELELQAVIVLSKFGDRSVVRNA